MKPSVTVDERGILLHVPLADGSIMSIPLEAETVFRMLAALQRAGAALQTTQGKKLLLRAAGEVFRRLVETPVKDEENGPSERG